MSTDPVNIPSSANTNLRTSSLSSEPASLPVWDRLTTWASENKAAVYTIAGVAVVISGAGIAYYLSDSRKSLAAADERKRLSKKERRKAKQEKGKEGSKSEVKAPSDSPQESKSQDLRDLFRSMLTSHKHNPEHQRSSQTHPRTFHR